MWRNILKFHYFQISHSQTQNTLKNTPKIYQTNLEFQLLAFFHENKNDYIILSFENVYNAINDVHALKF